MTNFFGRHRAAVTAAVLFLFALALRIGLAGITQFVGLYGQDAFAYYDYARRLLDSTTRLHMPAPFAWPLGYPALLVLAFLPAGISPLAGQWVSMLTGALVAPLVYLLTRLVCSAVPASGAAKSPLSLSYGGALVAGLIAAVSGQLLQSSIVLMADAAATLWAALSALALLRYAQDRRLCWGLTAALSLVLATFTRWLFGALAIPWSLVFLIIWWPSPADTSARLRAAITHAIVILACALPFCVAQWGALVPSASLNHAWLAAWNPLNAVRHIFDNTDGHFDYPLPVAAFYAQPLLHPYYIFPLLLPLIACGLWVLRSTPLPQRIVIVGWPLAVYVFLAGIPYENFRFGLALWPPLVVLAGIGYDWLMVALSAQRAYPARFGGHAESAKIESGANDARRPGLSEAEPSPRTGVNGDPGTAFNESGKRFGRFALRAATALSLLGMLFWSVRGILPFIAVKNEQRAIVRAVAAQVLPNGTIVALGLGGYFRAYAEDVTVAELYMETPGSLVRFMCASNPVYLLIEPGSISGQWANREPDINVRWLQANAGLREIARYDALVLYQIGGACA